MVESPMGIRRSSKEELKWRTRFVRLLVNEKTFLIKGSKQPSRKNLLLFRSYYSFYLAIIIIIIIIPIPIPSLPAYILSKTRNWQGKAGKQSSSSSSTFYDTFALIERDFLPACLLPRSGG
jgi:hypothetical protein